MTDAQAMARLRKEDTEALRVLYDRHRSRVFALGCRYLGTADDAEDLVQEVFVKVYEAAGSFRGEARFSTWLYRIAVNACLERRRRSRTVGIEDLRPTGSEGTGAIERLIVERRSPSHPRPWMADPDPDADPSRAAERRALRVRLDSALGSLSPSQRLAFVLRHWEGLSIREIAEALGAAEGTVKSHLFRAVRALRLELTDMTP